MPPGSRLSSGSVTLVPCRVCREPVVPGEHTCPACGAPRPAENSFHGAGYEYRSARTWRGLPLVHVAFGMDAEGRVRTARGVVAVGQRARGIVACGIIATGVLSAGLFSVGICSFGVVAIGLATACGLNAAAPFAVGVVAFGYAVGGVIPLGWRAMF